MSFGIFIAIVKGKETINNPLKNGELRMKKTLAITVLASMIALTGAYQAAAYSGMNGGGPGGHYMKMGSNVQMDEATRAKFVAFQKDTQSLRKSMAEKRAVKQALMRAENPDAKQIGALAGELFDLHSQLQLKAEAAGLSQYMGMGMGMGCQGNNNKNRGQGPGMKR